MKNIIVTICLIFCAVSGNSVFAQTNNYRDVVYLKNGSIIKGVIVENTPSVEIKVKTAGGSLFVFSYDEILKLAKEEQIGTDKNSRLANKKAKKAKPVYTKETLLLGGIAMHPSQTSGFIMAGTVKHAGSYLKLKSNLNFNSKYTTEEDSYYANQGYGYNSRYFNSKTYRGRFAATGGLLWRMAKPIIFYGGVGYGNRWVNWETVSGDRCRMTDISYKGLECETGILFKLNKLILSGGVSTTAFNQLELNVGVGITL